MKKLITGFILISLGLVLSSALFAQAPNPPVNQGTGGNQAPPGNPPSTPVDPGTGILLLMAAAYGLKKIQTVRKKEN